MDLRAINMLIEDIKKHKYITIAGNTYIIKNIEEKDIDHKNDWVSRVHLSSSGKETYLDIVFHEERDLVFDGFYLGEQQLDISDIRVSDNY